MPLKSHIRFPDPGTPTDLPKMKPTYQKLLNKHVLIIGETSGMGYAVAEASLASGADVTISSSNQTRINERVKQLQTDYPSRRVQKFVCDLSRDTLKEDIEDLFKKVGKLDHIVFTAAEPPKL